MPLFKGDCPCSSGWKQIHQAHCQLKNIFLILVASFRINKLETLFF